jgi:hypothetical protein
MMPSTNEQLSSLPGSHLQQLCLYGFSLLQGDHDSVNVGLNGLHNFRNRRGIDLSDHAEEEGSL